MGSQESTSTSSPVTAAQRLETYNTGAGAISGDTNTYGGVQYEAPVYERMGEGDYDRLREGLNATTQRQQDLALRSNDQDAADRGIFTSLNALRLRNDTRESFAPQFAANDATTMQLKAQDVAGANTAAMENANRLYESKWRPADYKAGLWNGTGGIVSSGKSGGWSI